MKTQNQMIEWYIAAVKSTLILNFGVMEEEAETAISSFGLKERILKNPEEELNNSIDGTAELIARFEFVGRPSQLTYKGFFTKVMYDTNLKSLYGRVYGIDEFVSFESQSPEEVENDFHKAVDEYLDVLEARETDKSIEPQEILSEDSQDEEGLGIVTVEDVLAAARAYSEADETEKAEIKIDEEFLQFLGINPDEYVAGEPEPKAEITDSEFEEVDLRPTPEQLANLSDDEYLKMFGIDPDDVFL